MPHPDLFVVCKNCQAEVSPYVTECPYCGTRVRKRAPKIERPDAPPAKPARRPLRGAPGTRGRPKPKARAKTTRARSQKSAAQRLGKLRSGEIPGIRGEERGKPWATIVLVVASFGIWFSLAFYTSADFGLTALTGDPWRFFTASLLNLGTVAQFLVVVGLGLYGWLLERRYGPIAVVLLFLLCGPGSLAIAAAINPDVLVFGSHGAALGMLCAWAVPVIIRRMGSDEDDDADLLGTLVIAVALLLVPVLSQGPTNDLLSSDGRLSLALSGFIGAALGGLVGLGYARVRPAR